MLSLKAGTHYGDWKGTAAADNADKFGANGSIRGLFEASGKVDKENEVLIAFEFTVLTGTFYLAGYYHPKSSSNPDGWGQSLNDDFNKTDEPIKLRKIRIKLTVVTLPPKNVPLS
jgi:hypothetical protein